MKVEKEPAREEGQRPGTLPEILSAGRQALQSGQLAAAIAHFSLATKISPDSTDTHFSHGLASYLGGNLPEAEDSWLRALTIENPTLAWNLALAALRQEDWKRGWTLAEARFKKAEKPVPRHHTDLPAWDGKPLSDGELLLWGDQGLGDQLMFARFLPRVAPLARSVGLDVNQPLFNLMRHAFPGIQVGVTGKTPHPQARAQACLGSLPRLLGLHDASALGTHSAYLTVPEATQSLWLARLGRAEGLRVGLAWAGNPAHPSDALRSAGLTAFGKLMPLADRCEFHSLQAGARSADLAGSCWPIVDWSAQFADMLDTAGLIAQLDLVITVDTAVAHLAGALGRPVWLLLAFTPDWRWSDQRAETTLWYPGFRLFRQPAPDDWDTVMAQVRDNLIRLCGAHRRPTPPEEEAAGIGTARCCERLTAHPLDRPALACLAAQVADLSQPRAALPFLHRGRTYPEPALALGRALSRVGKQKAALDVARALTRNQPTLLEAWLLRSDLARQLRLAAEAVAAARSAIHLQEHHADAWLNLANGLREDQDGAGALDAIRHAVQLNPKSLSIRNNLGVLLKEQGLLDEAIAAYKCALVISPRHVPALANLGSALRQRGDLEGSLQCFERSLEIAPQDPELWFGLGNTLKEMGRTMEAIGAFRQALNIKPDHIDVQVNLSLLLLLSGQLAKGWDLYEQRFHRPKNPVPMRRFPQPRWQGQSLQGERLLIWGEQGVGDKLMGYRLLPEVLSEADAAIIETDARLLRLMRHNFPAATWIQEASPAAGETRMASLHTPILSLARFRRRSLESFGDGCSYLRPPPESSMEWKDRLTQLEGLRVGLVWAGSPSHHNDANRSMRLERFAHLFGMPGVSFVSLQVGDGQDQIATSGLPIHDWTDQLKDYADTAGLVAQLDLVISVDTSVAHLAGALGIPTWVLIPFHPDWRWMENFPDRSPWYAGMRLFRQASPRNWDIPLARIEAELRALLRQPDTISDLEPA